MGCCSLQVVYNEGGPGDLNIDVNTNRLRVPHSSKDELLGRFSCREAVVMTSSILFHL